MGPLQLLWGGPAFVRGGGWFDTAGMTERPPEEPDQPFEAPEGVDSTEPVGDDAPAPDADLDGDPIPEDLTGDEPDDALPVLPVQNGGEGR